MESPTYELVVNMVGIVNILMIVIRTINVSETTSWITIWIYIQIGINTLFFVELISDLCIHGFKSSYSQHFRCWPETICQLLNLIGVWRFYVNFNQIRSYNSVVKMFELVIFVRELKLLTYLYEIKTMRIIIETMRNMMMPLLYLMSVLYVIYYTFALLGMFMFGGKIRRNVPVISIDLSVP